MPLHTSGPQAAALALLVLAQVAAVLLRFLAAQLLQQVEQLHKLLAQNTLLELVPQIAVKALKHQALKQRAAVLTRSTTRLVTERLLSQVAQ